MLSFGHDHPAIEGLGDELADPLQRPGMHAPIVSVGLAHFRPKLSPSLLFFRPQFFPQQIRITQLEMARLHVPIEKRVPAIDAPRLDVYDLELGELASDTNT